MLLTDLVTPPDTALCSAAEEMARMASDPFLYNHVSRSYVFGALAMLKLTGFCSLCAVF